MRIIQTSPPNIVPTSKANMEMMMVTANPLRIIRYLFSRMMFGMSSDVYSNLLLNSTDFSDIVIALFKCAVYGFFITLIPIRFGLRASRELTSIPVVVSQGMVNVFAAILMIEVLSLITKLL